MRKVSGSRPDGVQDKKEKKIAQEAWVILREKKGGNEVGKQRIGEKKRAMWARNQILFYSYSK